VRLGYDMHLLGPIAWHLAIAFALLLVVWGSGTAIVARVLGRPLEAGDALYGYAAGLLVVVGEAILFLVSPWLALGGMLAFALAARGVRARLSTAPVRRGLTALAVAFPFLACFGGMLGYAWHGPDATRPSSTFGDLVFYVAKLSSAKTGIVPWHDLLAVGQRYHYAEGATSFLGAALSHVPGFDPFLFDAVSLPVFFAGSLCIGIALVAGRSGVRHAGRPVFGLGAGVLAVAALPSCSWLVESPPATLALPLAFPLYELLRRSRTRTSGFAAALLVIGVDLVLTKFLGLVFVAGATVTALAAGRVVRDPNVRRERLAAAAVLLVVAVGIATMAADVRWILSTLGVRFTPVGAVRSLGSTNSLTGPGSPRECVALAGGLLVLAAVIRLRAATLTGGFGLALVVSWTLDGLDDLAAVGIGIVAILALLVERRPTDRTTALLLGAGALGLAYSTWNRDYTGVQVGAFLCASLAAAVASTLAEAGFRVAISSWAAAAALASVELQRHRAVAVIGIVCVAATYIVARRVAARRSTMVGVAACLLATGAALAIAARGNGLKNPFKSAVLTSADYDIWRHVGQLVPRDALVFTDETGPAITQHQGWNYYPGIAGRQLYLAGWYDGSLRTRRATLHAMLAANRDVLSGRSDPASVQSGAGRSAYFAVETRTARVPRSFVLLYGNTAFGLYRIADG
jgi:hypothetical protein